MALHMDVDGPFETGRQDDDNQVADKRKIDQVVDVLGRYKVDVRSCTTGNQMVWGGRV